MLRLAPLALLLVLATAASAQEARPASPAGVPADTVLVRVDLLDGSSFSGALVRHDTREVVLRTDAGAEVHIPADQIRSITPLASLRFERSDPNNTRLLFTPTARPLDAGDGYLAVYQLVLPFVAYGLTDRFSIAGGTVLLPGAFGRVLYAAPKLTVHEGGHLAVALGFAGIGVFVDDANITAGLGYGIVTYGSSERSVTAGVGVAIAQGELATGALVTLGGEIQLSDSIKLLTENYLIPIEETRGDGPDFAYRTRYEPILSVGVRFFGERLAVDLAGITSPDLLAQFDFPLIPWVGFAYNF